jgi:hypothetical protein
MSHATTIPRILNAVGIEPRQVDLVDKVLALESDKKKVHSVKLHHGTLDSLRIWAEVYLTENFRSVFEFKNYLRENEIFDGLTNQSQNGETYILTSRGVRVEFRKTRDYSQK